MPKFFGDFDRKPTLQDGHSLHQEFIIKEGKESIQL